MPSFTYDIVLTIEDEKGKSSDTTVNLPTTFTLANYTEFAVALAEAVNGVIGGVIRQAMIFLNIDVSGVGNNPAPLAGTDVEEKGFLQFATNEGTFVNLNVPAFNEGLTVAGSDDIDLNDVAVQALTDAMLSGISVTGGTIIPCDIDENDLTSVVIAREAYAPRKVRS